MGNRFLVTGAMGCLGAWTLRNLLQQQQPAVAFDLNTDPYRLRLLLSDAEIAAIPIVQGDITDFAAVERVVLEHGITHIITWRPCRCRFAGRTRSSARR